MTGSASAAETIALREAQTGFVALLVDPMLSADQHPELFNYASRQLPKINTWAGRLEYRVTRVGRVLRLHRVPIDRQVVVPPAPLEKTSRRTMVLTMVAAAALEDSEATTTLQQIADRVRALSSREDNSVEPFDPHMDSSSERHKLKQAAGILEGLGVLRRVTNEGLLDAWAESGAGIGAGYAVAREALLALTDPQVVSAVLGAFRQPAAGASDEGGTVDDDTDPRDGIESNGEGAGSQASEAESAVPAARPSTRARILRRLIETPFVAFADLETADLDYLRTQQSAVIAVVEEMTGGTIEVRSEGMVLFMDPATDQTAATTIDWPSGTSASWIALAYVDHFCGEALTGRRPRGTAGTVAVPVGDVTAYADKLDAEYPHMLVKTHRGRPDLIAGVGRAQLVAAGLIRVDAHGNWTLLPVAARYRDPAVKTKAGIVSLFDAPAPESTDFNDDDTEESE